jgi:membrane associated rhomboid family serine protease
MPTTGIKLCAVCRKDVSTGKRAKDTQGRYYCEACAVVLRERARAQQPVAASVENVVESRSAPQSDYGELELAPLKDPPKPRMPPPPRVPRINGIAATPLGGGPTCPCCATELGVGAKLCVDCGIKVPSGKPMIIALGRDENMLYANTESIIRGLSWLLWFGLYPIASEAYAIKKPIATWVIAIVTTLISIGFFVTLHTDGDHPQAMNLMLWPLNQPLTQDDAIAFYHKHANDEIGATLRQLGKDENVGPNATDEQRAVAAYQTLADREPKGEFHWYQLVTNTFLHDPGSIFHFIMHLGGNMLFLLIFGTRVNALIGNIKMAILYPLLGAAASAAQLLFHSGRSGPALGASGAIMGLAGMYLIFFPVHRVYMAFWLKIMWRIPTWIKIWPMRGFWVLAFYLSFDVISTLLRSKDGVAHWAHLGGFITGVVIATAMLVSRTQNANHGDLLSVLLGRWSWTLIGKPRRTRHAALFQR